jgi:hypothetical protein
MFYDSALNVPTMGQLAEEKELQNLLQTGGRKGFAAMEFDGSVNMSQYMGLTESANGNTRMVGQRFGPGAMNDPNKINAMQPAGPEATYDSDEGLWVCIGPGESSMKFAHATKAGAEEALAEWTAQGAEKNPMNGDEDKWGMEWKKAPEAKTVEASNVMKGIGYSEGRRNEGKVGEMIGKADNFGLDAVEKFSNLTTGQQKAAGYSVAALMAALFAATMIWAYHKGKEEQKIIDSLSHEELKTYFDKWRIAKHLENIDEQEAEDFGTYVVNSERAKMKLAKKTESVERDPYIEELLSESPGGFMPLTSSRGYSPSRSFLNSVTTNSSAKSAVGAAMGAFGHDVSGSPSVAAGLGGGQTPLSGGVPGQLLPTFAKLIAGGIGLAVITAAYHKIKGDKGSEPTDAELEVEVRKGK